VGNSFLFFQRSVPMEHQREWNIVDLRWLGIDEKSLTVWLNVEDPQAVGDSMSGEEYVRRSQAYMLPCRVNCNGQQIAIVRTNKKKFLPILSPARVPATSTGNLISLGALRKTSNADLWLTRSRRAECHPLAIW